MRVRKYSEFSFNKVLFLFSLFVRPLPLFIALSPWLFAIFTRLIILAGVNATHRLLPISSHPARPLSLACRSVQISTAYKMNWTNFHGWIDTKKEPNETFLISKRFFMRLKMQTLFLMRMRREKKHYNWNNSLMILKFKFFSHLKSHEMRILIKRKVEFN